MPVLRSTAVLHAALPTVAAALRDADLLRRAAGGTPGVGATAGLGGTAGAGTGGGRPLGVGDEVDVQVRLAPGVRLPLRLRATVVTLDRLRSTLVAGPLRELVRTSVLSAAADATLLTDEIAWSCPGGPVVDELVGERVGRRVVEAVLRRHRGQLSGRAEQLTRAAEVVAAAVIDAGGRVLAQQRARPASVAGRWELPGGSIEPGESAPEALVRECREELAVEVVPGAQLGPDVALPGGRVLRVYRAALADPVAQPVPVEHTALRWVSRAELTALDWLDADRAVLPDLELALRDRPLS